MEKAILMASGLGSRMRPLTEKTPKPLIKVNDKPLIETVIDGLQKRGISEIYLVVGYLKEQFSYLQKKYRNLSIIENFDYDKVNNISSIYFAREVLRQSDCFICEADLYLADSTILDCNLNESCYFAKFVKGHSDDWVFDVDNNGYISRVGKIGTDSWNMTGIAFFKQEDGIKLSKAIEDSYGKFGYETKFWDDVVNENLDKLKLRINPVKNNQIFEVDTVEELYLLQKRILGE